MRVRDRIATSSLQTCEAQPSTNRTCHHEHHHHIPKTNYVMIQQSIVERLDMYSTIIPIPISSHPYDEPSFFAFSCAIICLLQLHIVSLISQLNPIQAPRNNRIHQTQRSSDSQEYTYYRLGKNRPSSGNFVRYSRSALSFHIRPVSPTMTAPMTAVFAFQFAGLEYQPPAGDQTCLGYLRGLEFDRIGMSGLGGLEGH